MVELQKESFSFGLYQQKGTVLNVPLQIITSYIIIIFFNGFEFKNLYFKKVSGKKERCFIINGCLYINFIVHIVSELQWPVTVSTPRICFFVSVTKLGLFLFLSLQCRIIQFKPFFGRVHVFGPWFDYGLSKKFLNLEPPLTKILMIICR